MNERAPPVGAFVRAAGAGGAAVSPNERVGANVDSSYRYRQGISVTDAIRYLGERDAIHRFHAEDNEDSLTGSREGLEKGVELLERAVFRERPGGASRAERVIPAVRGARSGAT